MRDSSSWTLSLGRYAGVPVRLHASCLVCGIGAVFLAHVAAHGTPNSPNQELIGYGLLALLIWMLSLAVHQLGHLAAAARLGGGIDQIVVGPLGDLVPISMPHDPRGELAAALAGPAANCLVLFVVTPALLLSGANLWDLMLTPLGPQHLVDQGVWLVALKLVFWSNWLLLLANLLPALPLDAGRALVSGLRPVLGDKIADMTVARIGALVCILVLSIWAMLSPSTGVDIPAWLPLSMVSLWLFFTARHELAQLDDEQRDGDLLGYDFSQGYTSLEQNAEPVRRREPGFLAAKRSGCRRDEKRRRIREIEEEEERRVDQILARVKEVGLEALPPDERAVLDRVSARLRNRLNS